MFFEKRKLPVIAALITSASFLSACLPDAGLTGLFAPPVAAETQPEPPPEAVAPPSPPLYCKIGRGSASFGKDWYDFREALFSLHQGERTDIQITSSRGREEMTIQAIFDEGGQKLIFCPVTDAEPGQRISCASLYALTEDLQQGIKRTFDIPAAVRGGTITCAFLQEKLKPLTSPAAGGN